MKKIKEKIPVCKAGGGLVYNKKGEEVGRHEGFLDEKSIRGALDKLLAE